MQVKTDAPAPLQPVSQNDAQPTTNTNTRPATAAAGPPVASGMARPVPAESGFGFAESSRPELRALQRTRVQANLDLERLRSSQGEALSLADRVSALASSYEVEERRLHGSIARVEAGIADLASDSAKFERFEDADRSAELTRDQILDLPTRSWAGHANLSPERALALLEE